MGTFERIQKLIVDETGIDPAWRSETDSLADDLGLDSLDVLSLIMNIEEAFNIEISDADAAEWKTVADVVAYIDNRQP